MRERTAAGMVAGAALVASILLGLGALAEVGRSQLEPFSWAESRCAGVGPQDVADSAEREACLDREMAKTPWQVAAPLGVPALASAWVAAVCAAVWAHHR